MSHNGAVRLSNLCKTRRLTNTFTLREDPSIDQRADCSEAVRTRLITG